jgi:O-antigen/teichoic acid export membrane protein
MCPGYRAPLLNKIHRSLGYTVLDTYSGIALQLISTVVLARMLTPQEVGVFSVAAVFSALAASLRKFGVSEFLIQEPELRPETLRAALAVSLVISWSLGALLNVVAPMAARFYRSDEIGSVLHVLSISFFLIPFGAIPQAVFRRDLQMKPIFVASISANAVAFVVALVMAWQGFGTMSLAWSAVASALVSAVVSVLYRPPKVPLWPSFKGAAKVVEFGKHVSGVYVFGQLGAGAPEMIIGRAESVEAVAFYSRAQGLIELFNKLVLSAVWPVVLPVFAERAREEGGLRAVYLNAQAYLTAISWPILFLMGLLALPAIRLVYGTQWMDSVPLAQVLCLGASISVLHHLAKDTLLARGRAKECNLLQLRVQLLRVAGILMVVPFGLIGAGWGIVTAALLGAVLSQHALHAATGIGWREVLAASGPSLRISVLCVLPAAVLVALFPPSAQSYLAVGVAGSVTTGVCWLWLLRRTRHPLWAEVSALARRLRRRPGPTAG